MKNNKNFSLIALTALLVGIPFVSYGAVLNRQLQVGMSGSDVSALQTFLAQDQTLYPQGLVTGYFGFLTKAAVSNFQKRNGISPVGRVGPATLPIINAQMAGGVNPGADTHAPTIGTVNVSTGSNSATVSWNTHEPARGVVYYSNTPLTTFEHANSVDVSGLTASTDASYRSAQAVAISGLQPNTTYYYLVYATNQAGNVSVTWPTTFRTGQ